MPVGGRRAAALLRYHQRGRHAQQRHLPRRGDPRLGRPGLGHRNSVAECLSQMLDRSPEQGKNVQATCCGTWHPSSPASDRSGSSPPVRHDDHGADGGRARRAPDADGVDTGGCSASRWAACRTSRWPSSWTPFLYLWRREETDSGGPGRYRGGLGASVAITPHGTACRWAWCFPPRARPSAERRASRRPSRQHRPRRHRQAEPHRRDARRRPDARTLAEISDTLEPGQNYASSYLAPGEVLR